MTVSFQFAALPGVGIHLLKAAAVSRLVQLLAVGPPIAKAAEPEWHYTDEAALRL